MLISGDMPSSESLSGQSWHILGLSQVLAWCGGAILLSTLSYPLLQLARQREWCKFVGSSPHEFKAQLRGQLPSARTSYNSLASAASAETEEGSPEGDQVNGIPAERAPMLGADVDDPEEAQKRRW